MKWAKLVMTGALILFQLWCKAQNGGSAPDTAWWYGHYQSYRWIAEDVTEMVLKQADGWIGKGMDISATRFWIFSDTVAHPVYKVEKMERKEFLLEYSISPDTFKSLGDSLTIVSVYRSNGYLDHKIILARNLIVNYRGCFYYFRRRRLVRS
jgi:hypothetical protein